MNESRLIELYIKYTQSKLTNDERKEFDQLRFKYSALYNEFIKNYESPAIKKGLSEMNKKQSYNSLTIKLKQRVIKERKLIFLKIASVFVFLLSLAGIYCTYDTSVSKNKTELVKDRQIIHNNAQLITGNDIYALNHHNEPYLESIGINLREDKIAYSEVEDTSLYHTIVVPHACQYQVILSDSSVIHINSNSEITYPIKFGSDRRKIKVKGEVYCEVSKSTTPFYVQTDDKTVKVLGTKFNVRNYEIEKYTEITLLEGSVQVSAGANECILKPNQQVLINDDFRIYDVDAINYASWTKEIIRFYKVPIKRLLDSMTQLYDVKFVCNDNALLQRKIVGGIVRASTLEANLKLLEEACQIKFIAKEDLIFIQ